MSTLKETVWDGGRQTLTSTGYCSWISSLLGEFPPTRWWCHTVVFSEPECGNEEFYQCTVNTCNPEANDSTGSVLCISYINLNTYRNDWLNLSHNYAKTDVLFVHLLPKMCNINNLLILGWNNDSDLECTYSPNKKTFTLSWAISNEPPFHGDLWTHLQGLRSLVEVQYAIRRLSEQLHKLLGEQTQRGVVASLFRRRLRNYRTKRCEREKGQ